MLFSYFRRVFFANGAESIAAAAEIPWQTNDERPDLTAIRHTHYRSSQVKESEHAIHLSALESAFCIPSWWSFCLPCLNGSYRSGSHLLTTCLSRSSKPIMLTWQRLRFTERLMAKRYDFLSHESRWLEFALYLRTFPAVHMLCFPDIITISPSNASDVYMEKIDRKSRRPHRWSFSYSEVQLRLILAFWYILS